MVNLCKCCKELSSKNEVNSDENISEKDQFKILKEKIAKSLNDNGK